MKTLFLFLLLIVLFVGFYLLLSIIGLMLTDLSYKQIIGNFNWFSTYSLLLGWWLALIPTIETAEKILD